MDEREERAKRLKRLKQKKRILVIRQQQLEQVARMNMICFLLKKEVIMI